MSWSRMGDYIRGKKAYTKWDADSENIDIEYRPDAQKIHSLDGWLSGTKGKVIKILLMLLLFSTGIIIGFLVRRGIHETIHRRPHHDIKTEEMKSYAFTIENCQRLQNEIQADSIKDFLKNYTAEPHIAGKASSKKYVDRVVDMWKAWGIENVRVEKFQVLLSYPSSNSPNKVQLMNKENESALLAASESGDDELHSDLRPYLAYSPNKSAEGKLIYANYGRKEDFEYLLSQNISLNGTIVIMRLGKIYQANKVKFAEEYDAVGVLLYPDPADYVGNMKIYPDGLGLPGDGVIRGSLNLFPGDPQSPLQAATKNAIHSESYRLQLPEIPVQPISYNNALKFMSRMSGHEAPRAWMGGLNITYHLGPGHAIANNSVYMKMEVFNELKEVEIYDIIGNIKGKFEPDRYVIVGNHHDSLTYGTGDPGTGLAAFLEVVKAFGKLKETGWQPSRTIVFACWDAEEFGMIGSTEWLQLHEKELRTRAVAYINTDAALEGTDRLLVRGSPLLQQAVGSAAKLVQFPQQKTPSRDEELLNRLLVTMVTTSRSNESYFSTPRMELLGADSDYASFMGTHGISSVHLQFVSKDNNSAYRLYHSAYDSFDAVEKLMDPSFEVLKTLAQFVATLAQILSDSFVLPMNTEDYGRAVHKAFDQFKKEHEPLLGSMNISLNEMNAQVQQFVHTCNVFHNNFTAVNMDEESLGYHEYNDRAVELERALVMSDWQVYHLVQRHAIFGPHPYNMEEGVAFPHLLAAILSIEDNKMTSRKRILYEITQVNMALHSATMVLSSDILTNRGDS